jgi:hypothetical protein
MRLFVIAMAGLGLALGLARLGIAPAAQPGTPAEASALPVPPGSPGAPPAPPEAPAPAASPGALPAPAASPGAPGAPPAPPAASAPPASPGAPPAPPEAPARDADAEPGEAGLDDTEPGEAGAGEAGAGEPGTADAGGRALRLETAHGPVYVWTPPGYRADTAGVAVYVHGYYTDVDDAWREHALAAQFAASGRNALFIVPEAPAGGHGAVYWNQLGDLVREVRRHGALVMPWGPVVALGHSGAYRTLLAWLDDRQLAHVVLLDGLYGNEQPFLDWLDHGRQARRLTLIGLDTLRWTELAAAGHPEAYSLDWIPDDPADVPAAARAARLLHIRSQYSHMDLITEGKALPVLLGISGLPGLAPAARAGQAGD